MVSEKKIKVLFILGIFLSLFSVVFSAFPQFQFSQTQFPSGPLSIFANASSGTKVSLYINSNFIGQKDVIATSRSIYLNNDIQNEIVPIGATLYFINNNTARTYGLNFSSGSYYLLNFGNSAPFKSFKLGSVSYTDEVAGVTKTISVVDQLVGFNFTNIAQNYLVDGQNTASFILYSIGNGSKLGTYNYTFNYNMYPNKITITNYLNVTNQKQVTLTGEISDASYPLFYVLNHDGAIGNAGLLNPVTKNGNFFNVTVSGLVEGNNSIRFISTDPANNAIFTGEKKINVLVDTIPPKIDIVKASYTPKGQSTPVNSNFGNEIFINGNMLSLNISTDAVKLNYTFNNRNYSLNVLNGSVAFNLALSNGENNLTLIAVDEAGNIAKQAHAIWYDGSDITLKNVTPKSGGTVHFFVQDFKGYVNKPNSQITVFTIPQGSTDNSGNAITCSDYAFMGYRNLGQLDNQISYGPQQNLNESQLSLLSFIADKVTVTSDSSGKFTAKNIVLQEKNFNKADYGTAKKTNPSVSSVSSPNTVCFVLSDKYGNVNTRQIGITLDAGNTMWKPGDITTTPNTIYAAEIEQTGNVRSGSGKVSFGVIAKFQYIGPGKLTHINNFLVSIDPTVSTDSKYINIVTNQMNYKVDKDTGMAIVYFPVEVSKMNKKPQDYPSELTFGFQAKVTYTVDNKDIPIDDKNPIYFQTKVNVEKPLDHTKWLTPEMIEKSLKFLNKSIKFTKQAVGLTGKASVIGVLSCTAAKIFYSPEIARGGAGAEAAEKKLYMICDRVACTASPPKCDPNAPSLTNDPNLKQYLSGKKQGQVSLNPVNSQFTSANGNVLGSVDSVYFGGKCSLPNDPSNAKNGISMRVDATKYDLNDSFSFRNGFGFYKKDTQSTAVNCVDPKNFENSKGQPEMKASQLGAGVCFTPKAPFYDNTRCNFFGTDPNGVPNMDPANSIFTSIRCGCITDTYSHLKNWLKIQEGIQKCLQQARIGNVKGSYCERLMSQAVCDVATNIVLPEVLRNTEPRSGPGLSGSDGSQSLNFLEAMRKTDVAMNQRYKGTFLSKSGMQTDQLVNKACVAAVTGDWSILSENILSSINQNEVEPTFGPMFPESRIQGYNPLTGDLSIMYRFTYGVISGGQSITSKIELVCDSNAPSGNYCPPGLTVVDSLSSGAIREQYVRKGESRQDTVVLTDIKAKYWFNEIRITHTYNVKSKTEHKTYEENILHKGEVVPECNFGVGPGAGYQFSCQAMFADQSLLSRYMINSKTSIVPSNIFYAGNTLWTNLYYDVRGPGSQDGFDLHYMASCDTKGGKTVAVSSVPVEVSQSSGNINQPFGTKLLKLFQIPQYGIVSNKGLYTMSAYNVNLKKGKKLSIIVKYTGTALATQKGTFALTLNQPSDLSVNNSDLSFLLDASKKESSEHTIPIVYNGDKKQADVVISFANKPENVVVELQSENGVIIPFSGPNQQTGEINTATLQNIQAGSTCSLEMRILPKGVTLTSANFETYNPAGSNVDTNVNSNEIFKTSFSLAPTPPTPTFAFALTSPYENRYYCLNVSTPKNIVVVTQTSDNEYPKTLKIKYSLTSAYVKGSLLSNAGTDGYASEKISGNKVTIPIEFDKDKVEQISSKEIPATLDVKFFKNKVEQRRFEQTRKVYVSDKCTQSSTPKITKQETKPKTNEKKNTKGGGTNNIQGDGGGGSAPQ